MSYTLDSIERKFTDLNGKLNIEIEKLEQKIKSELEENKTKIIYIFYHSLITVLDKKTVEQFKKSLEENVQRYYFNIKQNKNYFEVSKSKPNSHSPDQPTSKKHRISNNNV